MTKQQSDRPTNRDDADARGEHWYPDHATRPKRRVAARFERDPEHYVAGADGTHQVTAMPLSRKAAGTDAKRGSSAT